MWPAVCRFQAFSFVYGGANDRPAAVAKIAQYCRLMDARAQREGVSGPEADDIRLAKRKAYQQWSSRNKDKEAARKHRYYQNNTEKCIAATKLYYAKNKQKMKEAHNRWVEANRQKWREYHRQWRAENRKKSTRRRKETCLLQSKEVYECRIRGKPSLAPVEPQTPRTPPPRDAGEAQQDSGSHAGPSRLTPHTLESNKKRVKPSKKKWGYQAWGCKQRTCTNCGKVITNSNFSAHLKKWCRASKDRGQCKLTAFGWRCRLRGQNDNQVGNCLHV